MYHSSLYPLSLALITTVEWIWEHVISLNVYKKCCSHYGFLIFLLMGLEIKLSGRAKALDSILSSRDKGSGQGGRQNKKCQTWYLFSSWPSRFWTLTTPNTSVQTHHCRRESTVSLKAILKQPMPFVDGEGKIIQCFLLLCSNCTFNQFPCFILTKGCSIVLGPRVRVTSTRYSIKTLLTCWQLWWRNSFFSFLICSRSAHNVTIYWK